MSKTVSISDDLARLLEERRKAGGYPSLDAAAEAYISHGLIANDLRDDHADGYSDDELRALIDAAETSGPETTWNAADVKQEILRRYNSRTQ
jgi:hypothetical protein